MKAPIIISFIIMITCIQSCSPKQKIISKEMADKGEQLFNSVGCTKCHSLTGENMYGPPMKFNFGAEITVIRNGNPKIIELDRDYVIRSMKDPDYEKLEGYEKKKMAKIDLSPEVIESIADYLIFINTPQK